MPESCDAGAQLRNRWLHPSGGLRWHLRALRERGRRWQDFRATVDLWLAGWRPSATRLLLIGPSAGWTLPEAIFRRFATITVLEPDPVARYLLARQSGACPLRFDRLDAFAPGGFEQLARCYPGHAILFCNLLGQLAPDDQSSRWCARLRSALAGHEWASWHDLASSARPPDLPATRSWLAGTGFDDVIAGTWVGGTIVLRDHGSFALAGDGPFETTPWPLTASQHHLVGWTTHRPN